jgi:hypothetical protein
VTGMMAGISPQFELAKSPLLAIQDSELCERSKLLYLKKSPQTTHCSTFPTEWSMNLDGIDPFDLLRSPSASGSILGGGQRAGKKELDEISLSPWVHLWVLKPEVSEPTAKRMA